MELPQIMLFRLTIQKTVYEKIKEALKNIIHVVIMWWTMRKRNQCRSKQVIHCHARIIKIHDILPKGKIHKHIKSVCEFCYAQGYQS